MILQAKNVNVDDTPDWLKKCMSCIHAYSVQNEDMEVRCRCKTGCKFKQAKDRPIYKDLIN